MTNLILVTKRHVSVIYCQSLVLFKRGREKSTYEKKRFFIADTKQNEAAIKIFSVIQSRFVYLVLVYSYFAKGCRIKCTRQS